MEAPGMIAEMRYPVTTRQDLVTQQEVPFLMPARGVGLRSPANDKADTCDDSQDHRSLSEGAGTADVSCHAAAMTTTGTRRMHNFGICSTLATWSARDLRDREITGNARTYD